MAYCTPADVRLLLTRDFFDPAGTAAELEDARLDAAIAASQAVVDAWLAGRYRVPFPDGQVPPLVASVTADLAAWRATLTYRENKPLEDTSPIIRRYADAQATLKALGDGSIDLPISIDPGPGEPEPAGAATVRNPYRGRLFGADDFGLGLVGRGAGCGR